MGDHMKHKAFELADEVAVLFYRLTVGSLVEGSDGLTSQMRRAVVSIPFDVLYG
jgi:hypothetical protein